MDTFTIGESTYVAPERDYLYRMTGETHSARDVDSDTLYLYDGAVVKLEVRREMITPVPLHDPDKRVSTTTPGKFDSAKVVEPVYADQTVVCPKCERGVGDKGEPRSQKCFNCGWTSTEYDLEYPE